MYANIKTTGDACLVNLRDVLTITAESARNRITVTNNDRVVFATLYGGEDYLKRYSDIAEALINEVPVYDCNKEVGYWKHSSTASHKSHPAPKKSE